LRILRKRFVLFLCLIVLLASTAGCASFQPRPVAAVPFRERAQTATKNDLTVTVAVPTIAEARVLFDSKLDKQRIQPVWFQVENHSDSVLWFPTITVDRDYFPPLEAAWKSHRTWAKETNRSIDAYFYDQAMPFRIEAGETKSGFVFTNLDRATKLVPLQLIQDDDTLTDFEFIVDVPGFQADHTSVDFLNLYNDAAWVELKDEAALKRWIEALPCCTTNKQGTKRGDPLNFILIAPQGAAMKGFVRAHWDQTRAMSTSAAIKTVGAALFGKTYRYAPISPLYVFGRPQDIGLQKARWNIHQRNHLRGWLAPVTYHGNYVWVGQISRDIGSRITTKSPTLTTHKIDPDVDEARNSLMLEMYYAHVLKAFAVAGGVGEATPERPRQNLTGDAWFSDGRRAVLFLSNERIPLEDVQYLKWETTLEPQSASGRTHRDAPQPN
jgi:hypothetical protein